MSGNDFVERMILEAHGQGLGSATFVDQTTHVLGLNVLRDEALRIAREHGFNEASVGEEIALMHSELSEALEDFRAGRKPAEVYYEGKYKGAVVTDLSAEDAKSFHGQQPLKPCGIPVELADVIIRIGDFCGKHGIDLETAVKQKLAYNKTRPHRHGNKKL